MRRLEGHKLYAIINANKDKEDIPINWLQTKEIWLQIYKFDYKAMEKIALDLFCVEKPLLIFCNTSLFRFCLTL